MEHFEFEIIDNFPCARVFNNGRVMGAYIELNDDNITEYSDDIQELYNEFNSETF